MCEGTEFAGPENDGPQMLQTTSRFEKSSAHIYAGVTSVGHVNAGMQ